MFVFFSSRRRHTRYIGDWSSDVCLPISSCLSTIKTRIPLARLASTTGTFCPGAVKTERYKELEKEFSKLIAAQREIGRASCRERVKVSGGDVALKNENEEQHTKRRQ